MLNYVYQLITPKTISVKYEDVEVENQVIVKPEYLAVCHADQRYYQGKRDKVLIFMYRYMPHFYLITYKIYDKIRVKKLDPEQ